MISCITLERIYLNKTDSKFDVVKELMFKDKISLENISFKYPKGNINILKNTNIEINKNDFFGIMGLSGSGKSTLITLLMEFLNLTAEQ